MSQVATQAQRTPVKPAGMTGRDWQAKLARQEELRKISAYEELLPALRQSQATIHLAMQTARGALLNNLQTAYASNRAALAKAGV